MAHTLGGITVHPDDKQDSGSIESLYAIQHVLNDTADRLSYYGAGSERKTLGFALFLNASGSGALETLKTAAKSNADVPYVSDQGSQGNWRILTLRYSRRIDNHNSLPVYECTAEMIKV